MQLMDLKDFSLKSFNEEGFPLQSVKEEPAFYALMYQGSPFSYHLTLEAVKATFEEIKLTQSELILSYSLPEFRLDLE